MVKQRDMFKQCKMTWNRIFIIIRQEKNERKKGRLKERLIDYFNFL